VKKREWSGMVEMEIGKWYDPISERWFVPREVASCSSYAPCCVERAWEAPGTTEAKRNEAQRIWDLLVDCAHR